jgi:hypothetical protein
LAGGDRLSQKVLSSVRGKHEGNKPASVALTPIPCPPPCSPERRAVPRRSVAFVKYVTICVGNATLPRLSLTATVVGEPKVELELARH